MMQSPSSSPQTTDVLIVGAGPVGLSLAIDLGRRGVNTILVERKSEPLRLPKMERTNPRSMEIYRRLGVGPAIRQAGLGPDKSMDIFLAASLSRPPLAQLHYPTVNEARAKIAVCRDGSEPREPWQLVSQYTLEPLLMERLRSLSSVRMMLRSEFLEFAQDAHGVRAQVRLLESDEVVEIASKYLVAADGAGSAIRHKLGIEMEGQRQLGTLTNVFFRCDDLLAKSKVPPGRHYTLAGVNSGGGAAGVIVTQDDLKHFAYHTSASPASDMVAHLREVTGLDIQPTILHVGAWTQSMLVAAAHGKGRVLLAGDANHNYIPAGGLGMNTGVVDAVNLSWKLAASLQKWGGDRLVESYCQERSIVARRTLAFVAHAVEGAVRSRSGFTPLVLEESAEGRDALHGYLSSALPLLRRIYDMRGADLGYRYESSVIHAEEGAPPVDDAYSYVPSTFPGSHLPHMWLEPEVSIFDRLGLGYTLLRLGGTRKDSGALESAMRALGAPLDVLELSEADIREVYGRDLVLVRPDFHVCWRGNKLPEDSRALASIVAGHGVTV